MSARAAQKWAFLVNAADEAGGRLQLRALLRHRLDQLDAAASLEADIGDSHDSDVDRLLAAGSVYVDDQRRRDPSCRLRAGQRVVVFVPTATPPVAEPLLVYRDQHLAIIDKPAGLPSTTPRRGATHTVESWARRVIGKGARLLHRLDQPASGLLLVSCQQQGRRALADQVAQHRTSRSYLAVVAGSPGHDRFTISGTLSFDGHRARPSSDPRARQAVSRVTLVRRVDALSLLQVELLTGRSHQIRAQLADQRLPIVGDERYGGPAAERLALHAHLLGLRHPEGRWLELHSPLPAALRSLLRCKADATAGVSAVAAD